MAHAGICAPAEALLIITMYLWLKIGFMQGDGTYKGFLSVSFNGTPGGSQGASCGSGNDSWSWPVIDEISVLGVGAVNGDTITVQVRLSDC